MMFYLTFVAATSFTANVQSMSCMSSNYKRTWKKRNHETKIDNNLFMLLMFCWCVVAAYRFILFFVIVTTVGNGDDLLKTKFYYY